MFRNWEKSEACSAIGGGGGGGYLPTLIFNHMHRINGIWNCALLVYDAVYSDKWLQFLGGIY